MAHNADGFALEGKEQNDHHREKPRDMAVTEGAGTVAFRLRTRVGEHASWMCVDGDTRPVKDGP